MSKLSTTSGPIEKHNEYSVEDEHENEFYDFDVLASQKLTLQDLQDHMTGPVISIVLHIIIISFLSSIVVFEPAEEQSEVEVEMVDMEIKAMEEPPVPPEPPEELETEDVEVEIERPEMSAMEEAEAPVADIDVSDSALQIDVTDIMGGSMLGNNSALKMDLGLKTTNFLGARKTGGNAPTKLKSVVADGLAWLATRQKDDGTFTLGAHPNAKWGACTLAFLGSGNSTKTGKYSDVVKRSIDAMLKKQGTNGSIGMHAHATPFIALALLDACALEPEDAKLRAGAQKILNYALSTQQTNGCWSGSGGANPKTSTDVDVTATGWWAMALISGRLAGLNVPENNLTTLKKTLTDIAKRKFRGKVLVSTHGGTSNSYVREVTIDSTLLTMLQFLGTSNEDELIQELAGRLHGSRKEFSDLNFWTMYQQGVGVFQLGQTNSYWFGFVVDVITKLTETQKSDGSWSSASAFSSKGKGKASKGKGGGKGENGGSTQYWGDEGATAMAILNLQVYFRYGNIHEMYERHGRLIPQKESKSSSSSTKTAKAVKSDIEDLGIVF